MFGASFLSSLLSTVPLAWTNEELISRFERFDVRDLSSKSALREEVDRQIELIEGLREMIYIRNSAIFISQVFLLVGFISTLAPLVSVISLGKWVFLIIILLLGLGGGFLYHKYKLD